MTRDNDVVVLSCGTNNLVELYRGVNETRAQEVYFRVTDSRQLRIFFLLSLGLAAEGLVVRL